MNEIDAIEDAKLTFPQNFRHMLNVKKELIDIRLAEEAANETFGYTEDFMSPNYVDYSRRRDEWKAITKVLDNSRDRLMDIYYETSTDVMDVLTTLTNTQREQVIALVESFLTTD